MVYLPGFSYPSLSSTRPRPVSIQFRAGWPDVASVPMAVRLAIRGIAAHWYGVRESHSEVDYKDVPMGFKRLCNLYSTGLRGTI